MNTRPAWGVLLFGALVVVALFFSPIWLEQFSGFIEEEQAARPFPDAFYLLSNEAQDTYFTMYGTNRQMTVDLIEARLATPVAVDEQNLPALDPYPEGVQFLLTGSFAAVDAIRGALGTASVYSLSDGRIIVRLENLDAINGPDLHVLISAYPRPTTKVELDQRKEYQIDLGPLKGDEGNQNYPVNEPAFNIENYTEGSVVLYSTRYDLVFSYAPLAAP